MLAVDASVCFHTVGGMATHHLWYGLRVNVCLTYAETLIGLSPTKLRPAIFLDQLAKEDKFKRYIQSAAEGAAAAPEQLRFRAEDVQRCTASLYHTLSKQQHGTEPGQIIVNMEDLHANDAYAVCGVLGFFGTTFKLINSQGKDVSAGFEVPGHEAPSIRVFEFSKQQPKQ